MALASSSLPTPDSPLISTVTKDFAARSASSEANGACLRFHPGGRRPLPFRKPNDLHARSCLTYWDVTCFSKPLEWKNVKSRGCPILHNPLGPG